MHPTTQFDGCQVKLPLTSDKRVAYLGRDGGCFFYVSFWCGRKRKKQLGEEKKGTN